MRKNEYPWSKGLKQQSRETIQRRLGLELSFFRIAFCLIATNTNSKVNRAGDDKFILRTSRKCKNDKAQARLMVLLHCTSY